MNFAITCILVILGVVVYGQDVHVNPGLDTAEARVQTTLRFYRNYVKQFKGNSIPKHFSDYWPKEDCQKFQVPDPIIYALNASYPTYTLATHKTLYYINAKNDSVHFRVLFAWIDSLNVSIFCIANHFVRFKEEGRPEFISPLKLHTKNWNQTVVRNITFIYPRYHTFDKLRADSLVASVKKLEADWNLDPIEIKYYLADTREEIDRIRGLDFSLLAGNQNKPSGISDDRNNIVYCSGLGENYFHEVVHLYLNRLYGESPIVEGLATFYGGSMGKSLQWHVTRLSAFLKEHPEIDLNKLDEFWYMDNQTNPSSTIQGMLCYMAFKRHQIDGLRRIMSYKTIGEIFQKEFNVAPGEWDHFLRESIQAF